jgi:hypothetical protein
LKHLDSRFLLGASRPLFCIMHALLLSTNWFRSNVDGMLVIVWNSLKYYGLPYVVPHYNMQIRAMWSV